MATTSHTKRDRSRRPDAKVKACSRKAARRAKFARLLLTLAFPAEMVR